MLSEFVARAAPSHSKSYRVRLFNPRLLKHLLAVPVGRIGNNKLDDSSLKSYARIRPQTRTRAQAHLQVTQIPAVEARTSPNLAARARRSRRPARARRSRRPRVLECLPGRARSQILSAARARVSGRPRALADLVGRAKRQPAIDPQNGAIDLSLPRSLSIPDSCAIPGAVATLAANWYTCGRADSPCRRVSVGSGGTDS